MPQDDGMEARPTPHLPYSGIVIIAQRGVTRNEVKGSSPNVIATHPTNPIPFHAVL
jgi:hypothetical protein